MAILKVDFYNVICSMVLDYDIQELKKAFPYFGGFLFLHVVTCLLDGLEKGIMLSDIAAVIFLYFVLHGHTLTNVNHVCSG